jgi:hypothetical protein
MSVKFTFLAVSILVAFQTLHAAQDSGSDITEVISKRTAAIKEILQVELVVPQTNEIGPMSDAEMALRFKIKLEKMVALSVALRIQALCEENRRLKQREEQLDAEKASLQRELKKRSQK